MMHHLENAHSMTGPAGSIYIIQDVFFWRLAGPVTPTGKAIVHWIGCINAVKLVFQLHYIRLI